MDILFYYFLIVNAFAFIQTAYDKRQAIKDRRRISEKSLLTVVFLGGTIGSGLAMLLFRHKIAKASYLFKFIGILIIQIITVFWIYKS
ncbi:DUF1294 domain-containing protein [Flavobacterium undicola]|uniref:DUF1294 domain-containing protein n=1 Tax=Flavobacterium undicola TaxID=1932779 RepID=UPI001376FD95|nr:DUF1294 domain-containing protein [Flavobacterium undicola]MBA0882263.1 DUF1294 domain-containing protein [Flavobacterium undicola]